MRMFSLPAALLILLCSGRMLASERTLDTPLVDQIRQHVQQALSDGEMAGCVVCVGTEHQILYLDAFGHRQVEPHQVPMTSDTVFDLASLTKPVATATAIMMLVERGEIALDDPVAKHLPDFGSNGKQDVTIQQLLTHQSGLIADNALADYEEGPQKSWENICKLTLRSAPGEKFIYSDVGFIVLAELIRAKTGQDVHAFTQEHLFQPLGMSETGFLPSEALRRRAAATEQREGRWMVGEVHDPRAYLLGGIAGHAGLFSTARDLARYAQMMLAGGALGERRVLSPQTVEIMTREYRVSSGIRGLGWDKKTGYSSNRGDTFSPRAFGHGGFTGTTLWVDPELDLFVIFLGTRLHPDGKGTVNPLAGKIGSIVAAALTTTTAAEENPQNGPDAMPPVLTGIDVLQQEKFRSLAGRRVGLITNHTGIDRQGRSTVHILNDAQEVDLRVLFSPEHGFAGTLDQARIADSRDDLTGLKIYSLYGETRVPTPEMLADIDTLVFDVQDIGARFYTYVSTMGGAMQAAAEHGLRFVVLDRPNPINGVDVAGPVRDDGRESFVAYHTIPIRHGMTVGELAQMIRDERKWDLDLQVIRLANWRRGDFYEQTGLLWVNPSPNMRSLTEALLYPGIGLLETTNLSVGRGTDTPFEVMGAPWMDGQQLAARLRQSKLPGVAFIPIRFTPDASKFSGEQCGGINIMITDRQTFRPVETGLEIARTLRLMYPDQWEIDPYDRLLVSRQVLEGIREGRPVKEIQAGYREQLDAFLKRRQPYLLYE